MGGFFFFFFGRFCFSGLGRGGFGLYYQIPQICVLLLLPTHGHLAVKSNPLNLAPTPLPTCPRHGEVLALLGYCHGIV